MQNKCLNENNVSLTVCYFYNKFSNINYKKP